MGFAFLICMRDEPSKCFVEKVLENHFDSVRLFQKDEMMTLTDRSEKTQQKVPRFGVWKLLILFPSLFCQI